MFFSYLRKTVPDSNAATQLPDLHSQSQMAVVHTRMHYATRWSSGT